MGLKGSLIGSIIGGYILRLPGALLGSYIGHVVEERFFRKRFRRGTFRGTFRGDPGGFASPDTELERAYRTLGASPGDSTAELKRKYHQLAKENHPDLLRSRGVPEREIARATERMSAINAAWNLVMSSRD